MAKRIAKVGVFVALAMIFSYIEAIIPFNFGIAGIKLGLANIVIVTSIYQLSVKDTIGISMLRIFLMGLLFGNLFSMIYSFAGGILSLTGMLLLKKTGKFSVIGISVAGGVLHNIGQLVAAAVILQNLAIAYYFPVLLISGTITGFLIGLGSKQIIKVLNSSQKIYSL